VISEKPWSADSVLRLFLGIIMTVCFGLCLASLLPADKMGISAEYREFARVGLTGLFFQGGILVWIWFFLRETAISWSQAFGLESPRRAKAVLWGATAAVLFLPVAWGMQGLLGSLIELATHHAATQQELVKDLQKAGMPWGEQAFMAVLAVLIAPVAEETLFRGILYPTLKQNGFPRAAWWVTSLLFAGMHCNGLSFLPLTVFSLVLIYLYEKTGSLWASITAHSVFNFANFLFLVLSAGGHRIIPIR
jgi:membrane protease YdiL (CAAX protease family)